VKTARCRCEIRYVPKFTAASRGPPCDSTASCYLLLVTFTLLSRYLTALLDVI